MAIEEKDLKTDAAPMPGFDQDYEDFQGEWEDAHQSVQRGGTTLVRQQDLKLGETRIRMVEAAKFFSAWTHTVQDKNNKYRKLICHGRKEIMSDKQRKPRMDPDNCPVCEHVLALQDERGYPKQKFYFRILNRIRQKECAEQGIPDEILILEAGPQLFDAIYAIATSPDYKEDLWEDEEQKVPKMDPKTGEQAQRINLTLFDLVIKKEKTGPQDYDVKYTVLAGGKKSWGPLSESEQETVAAGLPSVEWLITPSTQEKIEEVLHGESSGDDEPEANASRGRRTARGPKEADGGDVGFD
ncbi:MAG: hypothetical protein WC479_05465 [Candidatus Izemoplasmatales bacterium]